MPRWSRSTRWYAPRRPDFGVGRQGHAGRQRRLRHPDHAQFEDSAATDPLELKAKQHDLNYVKLDGSVG